MVSFLPAVNVVSISSEGAKNDNVAGFLVPSTLNIER
jgi:hypothetical protein